MSEPLRVAVLSLIHDHVWSNIPNLLKSPEVAVVAASDANQPLRDKFTEKFGGEAYADPVTCLDTVQPEAVLVCDSNKGSVELVELAASRGLHVIVEKPMASTLAGADRMLTACENAGVKLIINWPTAWQASVWQAAKLALSGEYGPIWQTRFHSSHNGPKEIGCTEYFWQWLYDPDQNGPAALMDYCCYGAVVCRWLLGVPLTVCGVAGRLVKDYELANDNAVLLLHYPHAFGILEASWTQRTNLPRKGALINCVEGAFEPRRDELLIATPDKPDGESVPVEAPPAHLEHLGAYLLHLVRDGGEPEGILDAKLARDAQAILEAGYHAVRTGESQVVQA